MGTIGLYGMRKDGILKGSYNHFDSYPSGLGNELTREILSKPLNYFVDGFDKVKLVDENKNPAKTEIAKCKRLGLINADVGGLATGTPEDKLTWYQALKGSQGSLIKGIESGFMSDGHEFLEDSLFCEWAYIVDLDKKILEVYRGFQATGKKVQKPGHNGETYEANEYAPVKLVIELNLDTLKDWDMETFEKTFYAIEDYYGDK